MRESIFRLVIVFFVLALIGCSKGLDISRLVTGNEVIECFTRYYYPVWNGHDLFVDRNGNSVIIEFGEKDVVFVRRNGDHQVTTNFPNADTLNARWYNCYRYKMADRMLAETQNMSTDFFRSVCDAVHLGGKNPTSLSTVYDVTTGDLYVYYFHNYEEVLVFNVYDELAKGEKYYILPRHIPQDPSSSCSRGPHNARRESCCSGRSFGRNHIRLQVGVQKRMHVSARKDTPPLSGRRVRIALWPVTHGLRGASTRLTQLLQSGTILVPQEQEDTAHISANFLLTPSR